MSYNILVVDDSTIARLMLTKTVGISGIGIGSVYEAANGQEALKLMSENKIDMVFADLNMPEMSGVEMIESMSENDLLCTIPVVIVSSDHYETRIEKLKKLGVRAYLKKPFKPEELSEVINDVLGSKAGANDDAR